MADAVHFASTENGGPNLGSSGWNGFPTPYNDGTKDAAQFVIIVSFDDLIKWYWRSAKWTLTTDLVLTPTGGSPFSVASGQGGLVVATELDLVQQNSINSAVGNFNLRLFDTDGTGLIFTPSIAQIGTDLKPSAEINAAIAPGASSFVFSTRSDVIPTPDGTLTANIDGNPIPLFYTATGGTLSGSQVDWTISEYHAYAASDGSPIYDTTTGAQLQDPRN